MTPSRWAILVWTVIILLYGWWYVSYYANMPSRETYTMSWTFQSLAFIWTRGPWFLLALAIVLVWIRWRSRESPPTNPRG